jgi:hypothetical protein
MKTITERPVDVSNVFSYNDTSYLISPNLKQYEVKDCPVLNNGKYNNWTNSCLMDSVIVIDSNSVLKFLDQDGKDISNYIRRV